MWWYVFVWGLISCDFDLGLFGEFGDVCFKKIKSNVLLFNIFWFKWLVFGVWKIGRDISRNNFFVYVYEF